MSADVLVMLTNWKRPGNLVPIARAMRAQSVPVKIVVADNHPPVLAGADDPFALPAEVADLADDVWRWTTNAGPPCRFAPALMRHDCKYTLFYDDDMVPGPRAVEHLLRTADQLDGQFATIGEIGRRFHGDAGSGELSYVSRNIRCRAHPVAVDMTCRAHFVRSSTIIGAIHLKWAMLSIAHFSSTPNKVAEAVAIHDDILLCLGIQRDLGCPSYLIPQPTSSNTLKQSQLPSPWAVGARTEHITQRTSLIWWAEMAGWDRITKPFVNPGE